MQFNGTPEEWEELVNKNKMSNQKQTAVEWYIEQHKILSKISDSLSHGEIVKRISDIEKQAKEMEKEQIMEAHYAPKYGCFSEQYYNETYGGE